MRARWTIVGAALLGAAALAVDWGVIQAVALVAALLAMVVVPGYLVSVRLLPVGALDRYERLVVTLGLGIAVVIAAGLAINLTPLRVSPVAWVVALLIAIGLAARRARASGLSDAHLADLARGWRGTSLNAAQVLALAVAASLGMMSIGVARISEQRLRDTPITQLWAVPANLEVGTWQVGVLNLENRTETYRLVTRLGAAVTEVGSRSLDDGETWTVDIPVAPTSADPLRIELYRGAESTPYRMVSAGP